MKSFKIFGTLLLVSLLSLTLISCGEKTSGGEDELVYSDGTNLRLAVVHNSTKTTITFKDSSITGSGLTLADGKTYQTDDLKPVWAELQNVLKLEFTDVYTGKTSVKNEYTEWQSLDFEGVDVLVGNADDISEDGKVGKMVNLADYLDYMPNFKAFLDQNPIVTLSVVSDTKTGSIYYAPYFDGFDDIEKYFLMRSDWLELLLDGEGAYVADISDTFGDIIGEVEYQPYMPTTGTLPIVSLKKDGSGTQTITKNYGNSFGNIVAYMNANVTSTTTGVELVNMFREYIDAAYNGYYGTKRSDLFAGYDACWDADELVALLRCIVTNTYGLTGQNDTKVTGIFPRETTPNRTSDLFSITSMFGVRGSESRHDYLYFDAQGKLRDARGEPDFNEGINKLNSLYGEGLILKDFDQALPKTVAKTMYQENLGFMIYDYCQTQTIYNEDETTLSKAPNFNLTPVINPVAKWYDGTNVVGDVDQGTFMRFTESWRSVKTNGWSIPSHVTGEKLAAAIKLFDFMYSPEGGILMSYGPAAWRSGNTITYKGKQIPELSPAALEELWGLAGGNYTNYARMYLGSTLPVGFVKDQGMEYQCTTEGGKNGAAIVSTAIAENVIKHVTPFISGNLFYAMVPTILPSTAEQDLLLSNYAGITGSTSIYTRESSGKFNIFVEVIKNGFGSGAALENTFITTMPASAADMISQFGSIGGQAYIVVKQSAWGKLEAYYERIK